MLYEVPIVEELLKEKLQDKTLAGSTDRRLCSLQFLRRHSRKDLLKDSKDVFGGKLYQLTSSLPRGASAGSVDVCRSKTCIAGVWLGYASRGFCQRCSLPEHRLSFGVRRTLIGELLEFVS